MGQIEQGLERALRTRPIPSSTEARLRFLLTTHQGSTRKVATVLGVSQRTVQRWVTKRSRARRPPGPLQVRAIEEAVLARWQPRVRARRRAQAEAEGFVFHTRARFGFAAPAGSSDNPRVRWITQVLPGEVARELFAARDAGAGEQQQMVILARAWGTPTFASGAAGPTACTWLSATSSSSTSRSAEPGPSSEHCRVISVATAWRVWPVSLCTFRLPAALASPTPHGRPGLCGGLRAAGVGAAWPSPPRAAGAHGPLARRAAPGPRRRGAG
ncbi:telomere-protecting terminal protein Tpg [Streptomyces hygroscopicus]|uniref:telomere-protecting terminal protein Tpg n=1 Tax=Streptomyces hygroscopicus TaxID=1912 RepID=UPI0036CE83EC